MNINFLKILKKIMLMWHSVVQWIIDEDAFSSFLKKTNEQKLETLR